jgi:glycosyltransferase involved in cell wall biosynthesis
MQPLTAPTQSRRHPAPRVSVGMPAYNAEATIGAAIESILDQTLGDFELIISDNASSDGTWQIIQAFERSDSRVIGIRQPANLGANGNYSTLFRHARAPLFKWASSNDWCAPRFLEDCVAVLEAHPDTVLVAPRTRLFESSLSDFSEYKGDVAFDQGSPVDRFMAVCQRLALNNVMNGVVRTSALARTRLIEHYVGADVVLVGHLALLGKVELLDQAMFYRRMAEGMATRLMSAEDLRRHHYPVWNRRALFPAWRRVGGWLHAVLSSGLSPGDTLKALTWALRCTYWTAPALGRDLVDAIALSVRR